MSSSLFEISQIAVKLFCLNALLRYFFGLFYFILDYFASHVKNFKH